MLSLLAVGRNQKNIERTPARVVFISQTYNNNNNNSTFAFS